MAPLKTFKGRRTLLEYVKRKLIACLSRYLLKTFDTIDKLLGKIIMNKIIMFIIFFLLISCSQKENTKEQLKFDFTLIKHKETYGNQDINIEIEIQHLLSDDVLIQSINTSIDSAIYSKMNSSNKSNTITFLQYYNGIIEEFNELKKEFPDALSIGYQQVAKSSISFVSDSLISIYINNYVYSGGAHGMEFREFLNFNPKTGKQVDILSTISQKEQFIQKAKQKLRTQLAMEPEDNWCDFTFVQKFELPKNIGLIDSGYKLIYNPYEILSYSEGHTEIIIPFNELK